MNFEVQVVDTNPKHIKIQSGTLVLNLLNVDSVLPLMKQFPGRTHKWIVTETNTNKVIGVVRFGSPTINSKPRNDYFGEVLPLSDINAHSLWDL